MNAALVSEVRTLLMHAYAFSGRPAPSFSDQEISGALAEQGSTSASGLSVPDYRQTHNYDCGAAATHSVAHAFGVGPGTEEEFIDALGTNPRDGTPVGAIADYLRGLGLAVYTAAGRTIQDLAEATDAGHLVIVPIQAYGTPREIRVEDSGHYVVVTSVDAAGVNVQDPSAGPHRIGFEDFERVWHDHDSDGVEYLRYGIEVGPALAYDFAEHDAVHAFAESQDLALGGKDGKKAELLLSRAITQGADKLRELTRAALKRLLAKGPKAVLHAQRLFDDDQMQELADQIRDTNAPAELLGRSRIRERHAKVKSNPAKNFSEQETTFHVFDEPGQLEPMVPSRALDYFRGLVPELNVDAATWGQGLARTAFTLAVAADEKLLSDVQDYIATALETGQVGTGPKDIDAILDAAGVGERPGGYGEMVFRTNMLSAYNQGAQAEALEVKETFPVWRYANPNDGRSRPTHAEKDGRYYANEEGSTFEEVRGTDPGDVCNCRCTMIFIDSKEWEELQAAGASVETSW